MNRSIYTFSALIGAAAFLTFWVSTSWGVGTMPDSISYMRVAHNLMEGDGFKNFGSHFPPLYPLVLAFFGILSGDVVDGARLAQATLYSANAFLFTLLIYRLSSGNLIISVIAGLAIILQTGSYQIHHTALSEGLFIFFLLLHLLIILTHLQNRNQLLLCLAGILLGLAMLTRYAGILFIATGTLFVYLTMAGHKFTERVQTVGIFLFSALALPLIWHFIGPEASRNSAPRELTFHPVNLENIEGGISVIFSWFHIPDLPILTFLLLAACLLSLFFQFRAEKAPGKAMIAYTFITAIAYFCFLLLSITFFDAYTPLDTRILLPMYIFMACTIFASLGANAQRYNHRAISISSIVLAATLTFTSVSETRNLIQLHAKQGEGYLNVKIRSMDIWQAIAQSERTNVYSNAPEILWLYLKIEAQQIPNWMNPVTKKPIPDYEAKLLRMRDQINAGEAQLFYFNAFPFRFYLPDKAVLEQSLGLKPLFQGEGGTLYAAKEI